MKIKNAVVRARIDATLKAEATEVLAGVGLELSDAIRLFLQQVVLKEAIPFPIEAERRVVRLSGKALKALKRSAQARDHAPGHDERSDLVGENRLLVRPTALKGAKVRVWPSGRSK